MWHFKARPCSAVACFLLLMFLAVIGNSAAAGQRAVVSDVRVADHGTNTRVVFDISGSVEARIFTLAKPYRVVLDLPEVGWRLPARPLPRSIGLFDKVRYGLFKPGTTRVVIETVGPTTVDGARYWPRESDARVRLVIDLVATSAEDFRRAAKNQLSNITVRADGIPTTQEQPIAAANSSLVSVPYSFVRPPRKPRYPIELPLVVIDPGHGGADPGASGARGTYEKHITLSAAREFLRMLEKTGRYRVILTRNRDILIPLRDRVAFARDSDADLFVSLHADSIRKRNIRGLSVYTLSENASDREAGELADRENKADLIAGVDLSNETPEVTNILIDLAQRETMNESARFAALMVKELGRQTRLLRNTHRFAGFRVLKAPDVPSVLVEMGFLSNRIDENALLKKGYRAKLGAAFVRAVDKYFARVEEAYRR